MKQLKKGQRVLVWSLQSFHHGGFLKGEPAFLRQSQTLNGSSVILCVVRNYDSIYKIDTSYEVYFEQVKIVKLKDWKAVKELKELRKEIMEIKSIW